MGAPRPLTARTLHFPLCFLFTCNRKNSRSSSRQSAPSPPPLKSAPRLRLQGHHPRCLWKLHLALLQNKFSFYTKENNQIKVLKPIKPPRLPHSHTKNFHSGQRKPGGWRPWLQLQAPGGAPQGQERGSWARGRYGRPERQTGAQSPTGLALEGSRGLHAQGSQG